MKPRRDVPQKPALPGLLEHPLFNGVRGETVWPILKDFRPREIETGQPLGSAAATPNPVHLVFRGRIGVYLPVPGYRPMLVEIVGPGGADGLLAAAGYSGHFSRAEEPSLVASVSWTALSAAAQREPQLIANLLQAALARLARRESQLAALALKAPSQRLARQLLTLSSEAGAVARGWVEVSFSHQMLADMLAIRRETVTVHLQHLARMGAVVSHGRRYRLNRTALERVCARSGIRGGQE